MIPKDQLRLSATLLKHFEPKAWSAHKTKPFASGLNHGSQKSSGGALDKPNTPTVSYLDKDTKTPLPDSQIPNKP